MSVVEERPASADEYLTPQQVADRYNIPLKGLEARRHRRQAPPCRGLMLMVVNSEKRMDDDKVTITGTWHAIINTTGTDVPFCRPEKVQP